MQINEIIHDLGFENNPVGLGGCKVHKTTLDCCEYDITVFDGRDKNEIRTFDNDIIQIHHGKIDETNLDVLQKYEHMQILSDSEWSLGIFLASLREKQDKIRVSCGKSCLIDAAYCATKAKQDISSPVSAVWIKCAAYMICDALVLLNSTQRSPTHMLESMRKFQKSKANEFFSNIAGALGLERATPSLLERMAKSTIGFSDMTENNNHGLIIQRKYEYLVSNSLLSDCYFYLGYINKNNIISMRNVIEKRPDLTYVLKVALDIEHDPVKLEQQAIYLHDMANNLVHLSNPM